MPDRDSDEVLASIDLSRVLVLGSSCSGKTTFAKKLSNLTSAPHTELDALHWGPNWTPRPEEELAEAARAVAATEKWIVDGLYVNLQSILWPRATAAIWLNYSFPIVAWRALKRTFRRSILGERLYSGNRESLVRTLFTRDSILLWVASSYSDRRRVISEQLARSEFE